jgi:hypothetical protein
LAPWLATAGSAASAASNTLGFGAEEPARLHVGAAGLVLHPAWPVATAASLVDEQGRVLREWTQAAGQPLRLLATDAQSEGLVSLRLQDAEGQPVHYRWRNLTPEMRGLVLDREAQLGAALPDTFQQRWMLALLYDALRLQHNRRLVLGAGG